MAGVRVVLSAGVRRISSIAPSLLLAACLTLMGPAPAPADAATSCEQWNNSLNVIGVPHLEGDRGAIEVSSISGRVLLTRASLRLGDAGARGSVRCLARASRWGGGRLQWPSCRCSRS